MREEAVKLLLVDEMLFENRQVHRLVLQSSLVELNLSEHSVEVLFVLNLNKLEELVGLTD